MLYHYYNSHHYIDCPISLILLDAATREIHGLYRLKISSIQINV